MNLKEILNKMIEKQLPLLLSNDIGNFSAGELLNNLSEAKLKINAHYQTGLYIARINDKGFLSDVLYRVK